MRSLALFSLLLILNACQAPMAPMMRAPMSAQINQLRAPRLTLARAVTTITVKEAHDWLADPNASWRVLDVRTPEEFAQGRIKGGELMNFYDADFRQRLTQMDRNQPYIIYCRSGARSGKALAMMRELGFRNAYDIGGGTLAWQAAGYDLVK